MSDWIHNLPVPWMALVVFGASYLGTAAIYSLVMTLAVGERRTAFKGISPGMLPPLGIIFTGQLSVQPAALLQVQPESPVAANRP